MEEMKLQVIELQKVKDKFITLEHKYDISEMNYVEEIRKNKSMPQQIKKLEKDLSFKNPLTGIRKILWTNIIDGRSSLQIIFE